MTEINIAAATTMGEARGKYLPAEMRNLSKNAQEGQPRFIESSYGGRMDAMQRHGEPSLDPDTTVSKRAIRPDLRHQSGMGRAELVGASGAYAGGMGCGGCVQYTGDTPPPLRCRRRETQSGYAATIRDRNRLRACHFEMIV